MFSLHKKYSVIVVAILMLFSVLVLAADKKMFSHKMHLEEGAECDSCHKFDETNGTQKLSQEACTECHDDGPPSWYLAQKARRLPFTFPHEKHSDAGECKDCHGPTIKEKQIAQEAIKTFTDCQTCHAEADIELNISNCKKCHGRDQKKVKPKDHLPENSWRTRHGREAGWRVFEQHGKNCESCHRQHTCRNCHKTTKPKSHTVLWRTRTHGVNASWDRDSCKNCHESGSCIRCHRSNPPLNHRGSWQYTHGLVAGSRTNEHCTVCHRLSWCASCHRGSP